MKRFAFACGLALAIASTVAPPAPAMGKPRVAALQVGLAAKGVYGGTIDGFFGPRTEAAVRRLQRRARIAVDGIPGPRTRRALGRYGRHGFGTRVLFPGMIGWDVSQTQFLLAWHGFPAGTFDGAFGVRTRAAVSRFQRWAGLGVDGVPGRATYAALRHALPRSPIWLRPPLPVGYSDGFGPRGRRFHTGLDYPARAGSTVRAAGRGRVVKAGWDSGGYGYVVVVLHPGRTASWYAHLSRVRTSRGQSLVAGTPVGSVGATGHATGPHLHFEVRVRGAAVNPLTALR